MKVLVIDDTQVHLTSALQTLVGHDVTLCASHDEANELLGTQYDKGMNVLEQTYIDQGMSNWDSCRRAEAESKLPYWDAVLCDLLMPAGERAQGGPGLEHVGKEMAVGWSLALRAAKMGAKYVAVASDTDHHHHPASAMLDHMSTHRFVIDGARVLMTNSVRFIGISGTEITCQECNGTNIGGTDINGKQFACCYCKGGVDFSQKGKDWGEILARLIADKQEEE